MEEYFTTQIYSGQFWKIVETYPSSLQLSTLSLLQSRVLLRQKGNLKTNGLLLL